MTLVHLTASTLFGGPERQMLGLARHLPEVRTVFASFAEGGRCEPFLVEVQRQGFDAVRLAHDTPHFRATIRDISTLVAKADLLLCHGYKANLLGRIAARRVGIPAIAVSRGWTGECRKVRLYERLDRWHLKFMDRVIAVSEGQANKVRACGVEPLVIRNAANLGQASSLSRNEHRNRKLIIAAGRLSPEKGFDVLVQAAHQVDADFELYGEGGERRTLEARIQSLNLQNRFHLKGFVDRVDYTAADLVVLPSYTEGLPNVALEASAAGVAVVATAVGGTPEVIADGVNGLLVKPGHPEDLAAAMNTVLGDDTLRTRFGTAGRERMRTLFTFQAQADAYRSLFAELRGMRRAA